MKNEDSRRFPQKRNGVKHPEFGDGVVTLAAHSIGDGTVVEVKFENFEDKKIVKIDDLISNPKKSESPDPKTSRSSGYIGINKYKK